MSTNNGTWTGPGDAENSQQQQPAALPFSVPETSRSPEKEREQQPAQEICLRTRSEIGVLEQPPVARLRRRQIRGGAAGHGRNRVEEGQHGEHERTRRTHRRLRARRSLQMTIRSDSIALLATALTKKSERCEEDRDENGSRSCLVAAVVVGGTPATHFSSFSWGRKGEDN